MKWESSQQYDKVIDLIGINLMFKILGKNRKVLLQSFKQKSEEL